MDLDALQVKYGKVGAVEYNGHVIVFRKPSRDNVRDYRRKISSDAERVDAADQLAQATIVAFDDDDDPNRARVRFTTWFLEEYPHAMANPKFISCLALLSGLLEEEDAKDLGKGVTIKGSSREPSQKASPNGLDASSTIVP